MLDIPSPLLSALNELKAACDECLRFRPSREGWMKTRELSGDQVTRSAATMKRLVEAGLVDGRKYPGAKQTQWTWRINLAGRATLAEWRRMQG